MAYLIERKSQTIFVTATSIIAKGKPREMIVESRPEYAVVQLAGMPREQFQFRGKRSTKLRYGDTRRIFGWSRRPGARHIVQNLRMAEQDEHCYLIPLADQGALWHPCIEMHIAVTEILRSKHSHYMGETSWRPRDSEAWQ